MLSRDLQITDGTDPWLFWVIVVASCMTQGIRSPCRVSEYLASSTLLPRSLAEEDEGAVPLQDEKLSNLIPPWTNV